MPRFRLLLFPLFTLVFVSQASEIGEINGAKFRIDIPQDWNRELVMYCHGYSTEPAGADYPDLRPALTAFVENGYALAQSAYAANGWAIQEAMNDTEALRRYFVSKHGQPNRTFITGHSMGGFLTMAIVESFPNVYDGGLALCGPLAPASWFMARQVFDIQVVFDYYFPGVLPSPVNVPEDFTRTDELNASIEALLDREPDKAEALRRFSGIHTNKELAATVVFWTYILMDLQRRSGGNPFDNHSIIYEGTADDERLNDHIKRYSSDPRAAEYLRTYYTPTGRLSRPMLAIHTTYDPLVPPSIPNMYYFVAQSAGSSSLFVQQYVKRAGHCAILPEEIQRGFKQLHRWVSEGERPKGGSLP